MSGRNEPCPCGSGKKYKKCCLLLESDNIGPQTDLNELPIDINGMESVMSKFREVMGSMSFDNIEDLEAKIQQMDFNDIENSYDQIEKNPLAQAQELVYEAWDCFESKERIQLAKEAIEMSKDCADAYIILADETLDNIDEQTEVLRLAVSAGRRAIGDKSFKETVGHFWGFHETRPFMRAKFELAEHLWLRNDIDDRKEAISHLSEMIELNPNDNQGVRFILVVRLLTIDDLDGAEELFKQYDNDFDPQWKFNKILFQFKKGEKVQAKKSFKKANKKNPYIMQYLTGQKELPEELPSQYGVGSEEEAVCYIADSHEAWDKNPSALKWLVSQYAKLENLH